MKTPDEASEVVDRRQRVRMSSFGTSPAFTLVEMLVVVGILALLATITVVVMGRARKTADKARLGFQLQTIQVGLDAYQTDFNSYPITTVATPNTTDGDDFINADGLRGARTLCKALMGQTGAMNGTPPAVGGSFVLGRAHQDGKAGLGFAIVGRSGIAVTADNQGNLKGKSYGPYLAPDKFEMANTDTAGKTRNTGDQLIASLVPTEKFDDTAVLLDANGNPILYYPVLNPQPQVANLNAYVGTGPSTLIPNVILPMYRWTDNSASSWLSEANFRKALGDANADGIINGTEVAAIKGRPILWSSGPDGIFGPNPAANRPESDDVTNFQGQ